MRKRSGVEVGDWVRLGADGVERSDGAIFAPTRGAWHLRDLSGVVICHAGVDTVRALYHGTVQARWRDRLEQAEAGAVISISGHDFLFGRMGKSSGYRYRLQSAELGVLLLVGSYYRTLDVPAAHLKVELSPHYVLERGVEVIQAALDALAHLLLHDGRPSGCAVHLAADVQGWAPADTFTRDLVTRARRSAEYDGISDVSFDLAEASAVYGKGETYMLGLANSLQLCVYAKHLEIAKRDKVDYWHGRWDAFTLGAFRPDLDVWRVEMRFHHSVVRDLGRSVGQDWVTFAQVAEHMADLWRYALGVHRLHASASMLDPFWQLLRDDVRFYHPATGERLKRQKLESTASIEKNIQGLIGNLLTLAARRPGSGDCGVDGARFVWALRQLPAWRDIAAYFVGRGLDEEALASLLGEKLRERRLRGRAA